MYKVLKEFKDRDGKIYKVGDKYDKELKGLRLKHLTTDENVYGKAFLKKEVAKKEKKKAKGKE